MNIIDEKKHYKYLTSGGEARIYQFDENRIMKIFENPTSKFKTTKIEDLSKLSIPGFIFPNEIVYKKEKKVGYLMDFVIESKTLGAVIDSITLEKKIEYLSKVEKLMKIAHEHNMFLIDINAYNFMLKDTGEIFAVDTDNFTYNNCESEVVPRYASFYKKNINNVLDENTDKFVFTLLLLEMFVDANIYKILGNDTQDIKSYIGRLKLSSEVLKIIKNNLSMSTDKVYYEEAIFSLL